ncbi:MAG: redoxin domain-containing protein [Planctomycetaceae bacterium]|nr:redoxin domain-containing protein [Planctomycetaceae bacterium]
MKRSGRRKLGVGAGIIGTVLLTGYLLWEPLFFTFLFTGSPADWELIQIRNELNRRTVALTDLRRSDVSKQEVQAAEDEFTSWEEGARGRCMRIAEQNPGTRAELTSLLIVASHWSNSLEATNAYDGLLRAASTTDIGAWAMAFNDAGVYSRDVARWRPLAAQLIQRVEREPDHPDATSLLGKVGSLVAPDTDAEAPPEEFEQIADLIRDRYAEIPGIGLVNFCEQVGGMGDAPSWGLPYEPHVRRILEVNEDRFVRCSAKFALASIVRAGGEERQPEARKLYEEFLAEFDGETEYNAQGIEQLKRQLAERVLETIRIHGLGTPATETVGIDLDGQPMSLADYSGKVILLSFWATWCFPCMQAIPHEKELVDRFDSADFAIVGVNADKETTAALEAVTKYGITWRSFQFRKPDGTLIADDWHIVGYPAFYLIDAKGIISANWAGLPPQSELESRIKMLIAKAHGTEVSGSTVAPAEDRPRMRELDTASIPIDVIPDSPNATGFVTKTVRLDDGRESNYVVFIPEGYDMSKPYPAILFLHGAGVNGDDGRKHLTALAPAINQRKSTFPFITIFPQARDGDWQLDSGNGKLAMAVLDDVMRTYSVDPDRVALTGVSMGGEGTWQLAGAYPQKWAAIIPLCGSGDPESVALFSHIPCWCFQGAEDEGTHPELSRTMVRALRKAGGQPIYIEFPEVGHDCWTLAYSGEDLFQWLLKQRRNP